MEKQLNCKLYNKVLIVEYEVVNGRILCKDDIQIQRWTINKRILLGGKTTWLYDERFYFEFVITDPFGISKVFKLFANVNNNIINVTRVRCGEDWDLTLKDFIENCTLWKCSCWEEALTPKYMIENIGENDK